MDLHPAGPSSADLLKRLSVDTDQQAWAALHRVAARTPRWPDHALAQHREIEKLAPLQRQIHYLLAPDHIPDFSGRLLRGLCVGQHRNDVRRIADLQIEIVSQPVARMHFEPRQCRLLEIGRAHCQGIHANRQLGKHVFAGVIGDRGEFLPCSCVLGDESSSTRTSTPR